MSKTAPIPGSLIIFGITGDLARKKLLPALYQLAKEKAIHPNLQIIGVSRRQLDKQAILAELREELHAQGETIKREVMEWLHTSLTPVTLDMGNVEDYKKLKKLLDKHETTVGVCTHRLFYLSIPAQTVDNVVVHLGEAGLHEGCVHHQGESRLMIEKPFGYDLTSAKELITSLTTYFKEEQIYRIDHYLAKETAQNILAFRFANPIFTRVWDRHTIKGIMITAAEKIGIEGRVDFYEQTGALRDFVESHLLQLLALVTMEQPKDMSATATHAARLQLLRSITPIKANQVETHTVRGQYKGYHKDVGNQHSITETFAAIRLAIDTERWRGVPILLRSGKYLTDKVTEITFVLREEEGKTNLLTIRIQPNEGISLQLSAKKPGLDNEMVPVDMDFCYAQSFDHRQPDAYERVFVDAFRGDKTLFTTSEEVIRSWEILDEVLRHWMFSGAGMEHYEQGSWGPEKSASLAREAGLEWLSGKLHVCSVHTVS